MSLIASGLPLLIASDCLSDRAAPPRAGVRRSGGKSERGAHRVLPRLRRASHQEQGLVGRLDRVARSLARQDVCNGAAARVRQPAAHAWPRTRLRVVGDVVDRPETDSARGAARLRSFRLRGAAGAAGEPEGDPRRSDRRSAGAAQQGDGARRWRLRGCAAARPGRGGGEGGADRADAQAGDQARAQPRPGERLGRMARTVAGQVVRAPSSPRVRQQAQVSGAR